MMLLCWILTLVHLSLQFESDMYCRKNDNVTRRSRIEERDIMQTQYSCFNTTMCITCVDSRYISNVLECKFEETGRGVLEVCTYSTSPQAFDAGCSFNEFYHSLSYTSASPDTTYWYPAKRNVEYGPYEFISWGRRYGINIQSERKTIEHVGDIYSKDCLIQDKMERHIIPEYCNALHRRNCNITNTARQILCASGCGYCSNNISCYTSRSYCYHVDDRYFWFDDDHLVCSRDIDECSNLVNMVLSLKKQLFLIVYHPECLFGAGNIDYIYCFTNAADQLKKRITLDVNFNSSSTNHNYFMVYQLTLEKYAGVYWCEARGTREDARLYTSNSVIAFQKEGHEFAVRLKINNICNYTNCNSSSGINFLIDAVRAPIEDIDFGKVRTMEVVAFHNYSFADIIFHVTTYSMEPGITANYYKLLGLSKRYPAYIQVIYQRSSDRCLSEIHKNLSWPMARQFETVLPSELCVQDNGAPVSRLCEGDFLCGLNWREVDGKCSDNHNFTDNTIMLLSFLNQSISEELIHNVSSIVDSGNLTLIDLYFVAIIFEKLSQIEINNTLLDASLDVVDSLLGSDFKFLSTAQEQLNLTDCYLRSGETIAINLTGSHSGPLTLIKRNVVFHSFNPLIQNASGFVLYKNDSVKDIPLLESFHDIDDINHVKFALYLPFDEIQPMIANNITNVSIVTMIYLNDNLFPSNTSITADLVISLNIPNHSSYLKKPVPLLISNENHADFKCGFWDYGDLNQRKRGNWSLFGGSYVGEFKNNSNLQICSFSHLTHLALLVIDKQDDDSVDGTNDNILTLITGLGSLGSIFGILGIFLTSCLFRSWRDKTGTQILLHLSTATLLEISFMYLNGTQIFSCVTAGIILQYVVISKFAWMLVYAFCQYLRFVRVFGPMPEHFLLKSVIFGWGFGLLPTIPIPLINPTTYYREKFCYPNGYYLYLGLYLPVAVILFINLCVFIKIMYVVTNKKMKQFHTENVKSQHIKLAILLFSVLGIPWFFGFLSNLVPFDWLKIIFIYIFTITSILQGFLMFLFYVIFNNDTRQSWKRLLFGEKRTYEIFSSSKKTDSLSSIS